MIRFAVIGTNWITRQFIDAAHESGKLKLTAIYSRQLTQARALATEYPVEQCFDSLEQLVRSDLIDAVYIASPNALHCQQSLQFMRQGKHVICEKPFASNLEEAEQMIACALEHQVVLFEAFKTAYLPNFHALQRALPSVGRLRKALLNYCQYSSRYDKYLAGENPNTFNPQFSNGSIMDIGFYPLAAAVTLWGEPARVQASASLLESGVDGQGTVILDYGDFDVTLLHSKVSQSTLHSEIQGETGSLLVEKIGECQRVTLVAHNGNQQDLSQPQHINSMLYEAHAFADRVAQRIIDHPGLAISRSTARLLTEIRRQTGVIFPADRPGQGEASP
ncbi:Gfo/Idh/MocA family protein [Candidatus Sodalis sp. SoCistrobi]|uniref:Gfo/Idh/MocA family protein n=1 Tax=Candidatus Sodalis sp. SoCistrobi TaxID=1922216 RepID=UPI00093DBF7D|nr:Gfo/Idh/MocA family oxidoreductase [Candidatus Sodalis sp. SoCistrobi]